MNAAPTTPAGGAAMIDPYVGAGLEGANILVQIWGLLMQQDAMKEAAQEARQIDARNFAYQQSRDETSDEFGRENLKLAKRSAALNEKQFGLNALQMGDSIFKEKIDRVTEILNNNKALADRTIRNWGI